MTEEIIVDSVNVAGCEYMLNNKIKGKQHCPAKAMPYAKETSCICRKSIDTPYNFCKHNPNCHYKQLKRLEQENKEEKKAYNECMHYLACMTEQRNKLKTALEEIKRITEEDRNCMNSEISCCQLCDKLDLIKDKINEVLK